MFCGASYGVSCRILYSIVSYLYVSCSGSITPVGEERPNLSANMWSLGAWDGLRYFIVALPELSI